MSPANMQNIGKHWLLTLLQEECEPCLVIRSLYALTDGINKIYQTIEPMHYSGSIFIIKHLNDCLEISGYEAELLLDLPYYYLNNKDRLTLQIVDDGNMYYYEHVSDDAIINLSNCLIYVYKPGSEIMHLNGKEVNISHGMKGSFFAPYFQELKKALMGYHILRVKQASNNILKKIWYDPDKKYYLKSSGSGSNEPEKYMQDALKEFLEDYNLALRGITVEVCREYNTTGHSAPKPVDIRVSWQDANRVALIEIKWLGRAKDKDGNKSTTYTNVRASEGLSQLYEYFNNEKNTFPHKVIRAQLVVIDARRKHPRDRLEFMSHKQGFHYADKELKYKENNKHIRDCIEFEIPMRMFADPVCRG